MDRTKRRIPIISFLLSILFTGLGHVYNGNLREGILFFVGFWFFFFALALSGILSSLPGLIAFIAAVMICNILIAVHSAIEAARLKTADLKWYNKWYVYVAVLVAFNLASEPIALYAQHNLVGARAFKMSSNSMSPTLKAGDHFLVKLERYQDRLPARGHIVIFPYPEDKSKSLTLRIIGLPGEQ
ncbi:MAG: signal peptidase I, partial [Thermodesulfobacteriota bacterium]